jgi:hypothetical protein
VLKPEAWPLWLAKDDELVERRTEELLVPHTVHNRNQKYLCNATQLRRTAGFKGALCASQGGLVRAFPFGAIVDYGKESTFIYRAVGARMGRAVFA